MAVKWYGDKVLAAARRQLEQNMQKATVYVKGEVQRSINRGNPDGESPSLPGEPPKKVTGRLFQSIAQEVTSSPNEVVGVIGTNVEYAPRLELGFVGIDANGRVVDQAPRPFLRRAVTDNLDQIAKILKG